MDKWNLKSNIVCSLIMAIVLMPILCFGEKDVFTDISISLILTKIGIFTGGASVVFTISDLSYLVSKRYKYSNIKNKKLVDFIVFIPFSIAVATIYEICFYFILNKLKFPEYDITMFFRNIATMVIGLISAAALIKLIIKLSKKHFNSKQNKHTTLP